MSHPRWESVYERPVAMDEFIDHVYSHKPYLTEIFDRKPSRVLEIGVGGGSTSIFLTYLGIKVTAIDNNPRVIETASRNNAELRGRLDLREADAFRLPFPDDSFDIVCHQGFFEHFEDNDIIKLAQEQLRVAPLVIFSVPTVFYLSHSLGERLMTKGRWESLFGGCKILKSFYYGRPRNDSPLKRLLAAVGWRNIYYCCVLGRK